MPPIRGHSKTFVLFDPSYADDDDDETGMPPLVDNPFAFTLSPKSNITDHSLNQHAHKFTFEHDLIKPTLSKDDDAPVLVDADQIQTITFAPPYIVPTFFEPAKESTDDDSDLPPLVEPPTVNDDEKFKVDSDGNFLAGNPFAADLETSALQTRESNDPSYIPRPPNAFILFRSSFIKAHKVSGGRLGNKTLAKTISLAWRNLSPEERAEWEAKALVAQAEHRQRYPDWRFNHATGDGKRRTKKVKDGPLKTHKRSISTTADSQSKSTKGKEGNKQEERAVSQSAQDKTDKTNSAVEPARNSKEEQPTDAQLLLKCPHQDFEKWGNLNTSLQAPQSDVVTHYANASGPSHEANVIGPRSLSENASSMPEATLLFHNSTTRQAHNTSAAAGDAFLSSQATGSSASDVEQPEPPPTSPFLGSDSALSSPESPFVISFSEPFLPYFDTDSSGLYAVPSGQFRPSPIQFAAPNLFATRRPSPASVIASMYRQSMADQQAPLGGSLSHGGSPITSNVPFEGEGLDPLNRAKSPGLKRSSSAPAPRDRLRPLTHQALPASLEGTATTQGRPSLQMRSNLSYSLTAQNVGHTMEPVHPSISEGHTRGQAPYPPSSPTKRGRVRGATTTSSLGIRGPRRLLNHGRRESFSGFSTPQVLLPVRPANPPMEDASLHHTHGQSVNDASVALQNYTDAASSPHSWPSISPLSLSLRPQFQHLQSSAAAMPSQFIPMFSPDPHLRQVPEGNADQYPDNSSFFATPNTTAMHFSFAPTASSSFSSLANWAGESSENNK